MNCAAVKQNKIRTIFIILSVLSVALIAGFYVHEVNQALGMDKSSFACTRDGMMMQSCHHPYSSSITWGLLGAAMYGWPLLLAWFVVGIVYITKSEKLQHKV